MNHYGHRALEFSREHRPTAFAENDNPSEFFTKVGEELQSEISHRRDAILGKQQPSESPEEHRLRSYQALVTAEELTVADHYLFQPEASKEHDSEDDPDLARYYDTLSQINEPTDSTL